MGAPDFFFLKRSTLRSLLGFGYGDFFGFPFCGGGGEGRGGGECCIDPWFHGGERERERRVYVY